MIVRGQNKASYFTLAAIALIPTVGASAQSVQDPSLQKLVQTPQYQANIARLFGALPSDVFQRCSTLASRGSNVTIVQPASFAADGYPISGVWKQSFPVSGCGNDTVINFYFRAQSNEKIVSMIAAPGDTHANPTLQQDAVRYAMMAVRAKITACNDPHLRTTRFDGRLTRETGAGSPKGPNNTGGWRETWTISACGQFFTVPLTFSPDATGTQVVAASATETSR